MIPCEVQAIRIGDLGIVTNGAEFFCQLGLDIKAASPFARTWVVSLANQWIGYVATPSAYYAGGYEPRTARSAKMAPWAGQSLVEASLAALKQVAGVSRRLAPPLFDRHECPLARLATLGCDLPAWDHRRFGTVISWTHVWITCGDWLTLRSVADHSVPATPARK